MIEISVTLIKATKGGERQELARMHICNDGTGTQNRRNYIARVLRGRSKKQLDQQIPHKQATIQDYPSEQVHVWNLVCDVLKRLGYGGVR